MVTQRIIEETIVDSYRAGHTLGDKVVDYTRITPLPTDGVGGVAGTSTLRNSSDVFSDHP